jgi:outer membrane protein OmpA-like peptidoglycan-associated protein
LTEDRHGFVDSFHDRSGSMTCSASLGLRAVALAGLVALSAGIVLPDDATAQTRHGDTIMFDRPPTMDELNALFGTERSRSDRRPRTRKPVFGVEPEASGSGGWTQGGGGQALHGYGSGSSGQAPAAHQPPAGQVASTDPAAGMPVKIGYPLQVRLNSAQILSDHLPFLDKIGQWLDENPGRRMVIAGHADATGSAQHNQHLSQRRALSVQNYLVQARGVDPRRLSAVGHGEARPLPGLAPTDPKNRRVVFIKR